MKKIYLIIYTDDNTIEGYVRSEKEFKTWVGDHNMQRIIEGEAPESIAEFTLKEVKYIGRK
jgi:hypothetical protein